MKEKKVSKYDFLCFLQSLCLLLSVCYHVFSQYIKEAALHCNSLHIVQKICKNRMYLLLSIGLIIVRIKGHCSMEHSSLLKEQKSTNFQRCSLFAMTLRY